MPLYHAILRIQVNDSTDFNKAALKAAALIDSNSAGFRDAVQSEASHLAKSQYVRQLNPFFLESSGLVKEALGETLYENYLDEKHRE
jgi:hypothetical protein